MKSDWMSCRADEFCSAVTDGTHDSPKAQISGRYLITSKHLKGNWIDFSSANKISEEDYQKVIKRSQVQQWDILFSMIGTIGTVYLEKNPITEYACKNMGIFKFSGRKESAMWMYYYLQSPQAKKYIQSHLRGSTQAYVPLGSLRELPILIPPEEVRKQIINILVSLDNKIELNQRINDNLQQQVQAVYKSWFIEGKESNGCLTDICQYPKEKVAISSLDLDRYYSTENMLPGKSGSVKAANLPTTVKTTKCKIGDVLVSNIRPYFKKIVYCQAEGGCSTDVLCFTPNTPELSAFLFNTLYADKFFDFMVAGSKGTKMPRGDKQQIMTYPVKVPSSDELESFNSIVRPILGQIDCNKRGNVRLAALRDTLLPKLMSGEINISITKDL